MNPDDKLKEAFKEEYFEHHGCLTGDCPHWKNIECLELSFIAGAAYIRETEVKALLEIVKESKWFIQDVLARVNQAIATDCPECDYQCQGCIKSVDDAEAMKRKIDEKLKSIGVEI